MRQPTPLGKRRCRSKVQYYRSDDGGSREAHQPPRYSARDTYWSNNYWGRHSTWRLLKQEKPRRIASKSPRQRSVSYYPSFTQRNLQRSCATTGRWKLWGQAVEDRFNKRPGIVSWKDRGRQVYSSSRPVSSQKFSKICTEEAKDDQASGNWGSRSMQSHRYCSQGPLWGLCNPKVTARWQDLSLDGIAVFRRNGTGCSRWRSVFSRHSRAREAWPRSRATSGECMQPQVIQIENRPSSLPAHFHDRRIRITWAGSYYQRTFVQLLLLNKSNLKKALKFAWCAQLLLEDSSKPLGRVWQSIPVQR